MRQLHLKRAFPRPRPLAEDIENEPRAVDDLAAPGAFQIALLNRRQRSVHHHQRDLVRLQILMHPLHLALAEQGRRPPVTERHDVGVHQHETDGGR